MAPDEFVAAAAKLVQRRPPGKWEADNDPSHPRKPFYNKPPRNPNNNNNEDEEDEDEADEDRGPAVIREPDEDE